MSYPVPPQQPVYVQPPPDSGKRFLNMSGGILALVITAVLLLCVVGPCAFCVGAGLLGQHVDSSSAGY